MKQGKKQNLDKYKEQARLHRVLSNESRLMIIDQLKERECSAGELVQLVGSDQSTVSKHLALLRSYGVVEDRREGNQVFYRLLMPCIVNFFSCATQAIEEQRRKK
jgi:DNA-binding transcriptional ArsR family regulator